jgi:hypothetical protein
MPEEGTWNARDRTQGGGERRVKATFNTIAPEEYQQVDLSLRRIG